MSMRICLLYILYIYIYIYIYISFNNVIIGAKDIYILFYTNKIKVTKINS